MKRKTKRNKTESSKSSTTSTTPTKVSTDRKELAGPEICSIIEACAKGEVAFLRFGGLEIHRQANGEYPVNPDRTPRPTESVERHNQEKNEEALREQERLLREQQMEELKLTDPVKFEEMLNAGEFDNDSDESESGDDQSE